MANLHIEEELKVKVTNGKMKRAQGIEDGEEQTRNKSHEAGRTWKDIVGQVTVKARHGKML